MRRWPPVWALLAGAVHGCATPTALVVEVESELDCTAGASVVVVGARELAELPSRAPASSATRCEPTGASFARGSVVLLPSEEPQISFAVMTRGNGQDASDCLTRPDGCIVAKRQLSFVERATLRLRIKLQKSCVDVACGERSTCDQGRCVSAALDCTSTGCAAARPVYLKASNTSRDAVFGHSVALSADGSTIAVGAVGETSDATGVNGSETNSAAPGAGAVYVFARKGRSWVQQAYVKASNTAREAEFGFALALSADGSTLAVGAHLEGGASVGVNGNQTPSGADASGAAYIFVRSGDAWAQQAYFKASNSRVGAMFGTSLALTADGNTLAVGSPGESSAATGVDGDQGSTAAPASGAVYVFERMGSAWTQRAYVKAANARAAAELGGSLAFSADGAALAIGAPSEDGMSVSDPSGGGPRAGAAYVFERSGATWSQLAYLKASNPRAQAKFAAALALSADASTLVVGANYERSNARGVDGDQADASAPAAGAAYVFARTGATYAQQAYLKASNTRANAFFGQAACLSANCDQLLVGSPGENSAATGFDGNATDTSAFQAGAVYAFERTSGAWSQTAYVKAPNTHASGQFGLSCARSPDGASFVIGSGRESSGARGVGGDQTDRSAPLSGAAFVY